MVFQVMMKSRNKSPNTTKDVGSEPEGTCSSILALTLYVSRIVGVAPVHMKRERNRWRISCSKAFAWYSYVLKVALDVCLIYGLIMDLYVDSNKSVRSRTATGRPAWYWYLDLEFVISISNYGVLTASKRMKAIIESLNLLDGVYQEVRPPKAIKKLALLVSLLVFAFVVIFGDFISFVADAILHGKDIQVAFLYICYYIEAFLCLMMSLQFIVVGILVDTALTSISFEVERIIQSCDQKDTAEKSYSLLREPDFISTTTPFPKLQPIVDIMLVQKKKVQSARETESSLRSLARAYTVTCKMLKYIDNCFGVISVLALAYVFFQLIMAPYYLAGFAFNNKPEKIHIAFEVGYTIFHCINMVLLIQPSSLIKKQMARTEMLLSQLLRRITPEDHRFKDLEYFYQQVMMYQPEFTSLGIGNRQRPLVIAVTAGLGNYLTIVLQIERTSNEEFVTESTTGGG